jgi:hypothetical protein
LQVPLQHSVGEAHVVPVDLQHFFTVGSHGQPEQQSAVVAQTAPRSEQPHVPVPPLHTTPQQSFEFAHGPVVMQPHFFCELQGVPTQQSAPRVQPAPVVPQPHVEVARLHTPEQQSPSAVHPFPSGAQHLPKGQAPPLQQSASTWQATPGMAQPHSPVARLQLPVQQLRAETAQGCPSGWHVPQTIDVPVSRQSRPEPLQQSE